MVKYADFPIVIMQYGNGDKSAKSGEYLTINCYPLPTGGGTPSLPLLLPLIIHLDRFL